MTTPNSIESLVYFAIVIGITELVKWYFTKKPGRLEVEAARESREIEREKQNNETYKMLGDLLSKVIEGSKSSTDTSRALSDMLTQKIKQIDIQADQIEEIKNDREKSKQRIVELESHVDQMGREYAAATAKQNEKISALENEVTTLRVENSAAKSVITKILKHMVDKKYDLPPDLNGDLEKLGDSVRKLIWKK